MDILTTVGAVSIARRYFWSRAMGGLCPVDQPLGVHDNTATRGARHVCCTLGVIHDFDQAAHDLYTVAGIRISAEKLRQLVEQEGRSAHEARLSGTLSPAWSAPEAKRVYVGADGVLVRTITQDEKQKRRQQHETIREGRERVGIGNTKPLPSLRPGTTDKFKEMKIGLFYDQKKTRVHTFATQENHIGFGHLLENQAMQLAIERADESISLTDGACWIRNRILEHIPYIGVMLLDYYHFSEHVWDAAKCCFPDPQESKAWAEARLREVKEVGPMAILAAIAELKAKVRSASKRECLRLLRGYIVERFEMLDYRRALARGWDIGQAPRPHRSHVQEPDAPAKANGHEMEPGQRRRRHELGSPTRKRPVEPVVGPPCRLMPQNMGTPQASSVPESSLADSRSCS